MITTHTLRDGGTAIVSVMNGEIHGEVIASDGFRVANLWTVTTGPHVDPNRTILCLEHRLSGRAAYMERNQDPIQDQIDIMMQDAAS